MTGKTVPETFADMRRGLPANADFQAFSSAHQMSATQLASAYCDALVQSGSLSAAMFPGFDFNAPVDDPGHDWRNGLPGRWWIVPSTPVCWKTASATYSR